MGETKEMGNRKYLLIGLGGSGGKVISKLYDQLLKERGESIKRDVVRVAIDTDQEALRELKNQGVETIQISGSGTVGQMVNTLGEDVLDWCPATRNEGNFYSSYVFNGASQCRLKSRLCFASFLKNSNNSLKRVLEEFLLVTSSGSSVKDAPPLVYIVSSVAGGTGSGIFIQTAFYIKKFFLDMNLQPNIYGLFACPDLYKDAVSPQQLPSLYANAYAVIRELNAFNMICGADTEAPWGGKVTLDVELSTKSEGMLFTKNALGRYGEKPYDVLYFVDRVNYMSNILGGLDAYYEAMSRMAYAHLYSEISGEVLSNESNEMNAHSMAPCAIYGSAGASSLRYPYEDIIAYFADRNIYESIDDAWKELDTKWHSYLTAKNADARASGLPRYHPAAGERGKHFCRDFEAATNKENMTPGKLSFMAHMVERNGIPAVSYLTDKIEAEAEVKIQSDERFASKKQALGLADAAQAKKNILAVIRGEAAGGAGMDAQKGDQFTRIRQIDEVLDDYCEAGLRFAFDDSIELANKILCLDPSLYPVYEQESKCSVVKLLLQNPESEGEWVHPVAGRYMLYQFREKLQEKMGDLLGGGEDTPADDLEDFRNKLIRSYVKTHLRKLADSDDGTALTANADVLKALISRWFGKRDTQRGVEEYFRSLDSTLEGIETGFVEALMFFAYCRVQSRLDALIREYEVFFDNLDEFTRNAFRSWQKLETYHDDSTEAVFVCADSVCKQALYESVEEKINLKTGEIASNIAGGLFGTMRAKAGVATDKRNHREDVRNAATFFDSVSALVAEGLKKNNEIETAVDKNVLQAILCEYRIKNSERASDVENYSKDEEAKSNVDFFISKKLTTLATKAAPSLQYNIRDIYHAMFQGNDEEGNSVQKREVTNTYRYIAHSAECVKSIEDELGISSVQSFYDGHAVQMPVDSGNQTVTTKFVESQAADPYTILCYTTVHCLQPYQIRAFDEINHGVYYSHYSKRIADMESLQKYSMTPHMDKRWHKHGTMPYINVSKEKERRYDVAKAFLYALCYGKIGFYEKGSESKLVFNDPNLDRMYETIYYQGKSIPKGKLNRVMYWFADQEELIERYSSLFDNAVEKEIEKLSRYDESAGSYKTGITNYANILRQMRFNIFRDLAQTKKKAADDATKKTAADKNSYSILRFAWELHLSEEKELDKNYGELLVETLCMTIKKYAKAPYNKEAIEQGLESSEAYKCYEEVGRHVAEIFLKNLADYIRKDSKLKEETEAEKKARLKAESYGRTKDDLDDTAGEVDGVDKAVADKLAKDKSFAWVRTLIDAQFPVPKQKD